MLLMNGLHRLILASVLLSSFALLTACEKEEKVAWSGGDLRAVNHLSSGVNKFSVNDSGGGGVQPYGKGGGVCCISLPNKWQPELKAHVEWEVDPDPYAKLPRLKEGVGYEEEAYARHIANYEKHSATVDIPEYDRDRCGMTVHFLPCNQIKVTTSCWMHGAAEYPIKEPREMKEPAACPK